jgi:hypothetical protein
MNNAVFWDVATYSSCKSQFLTTATRRNIPEDGILQSARRENLRSYVGNVLDWRGVRFRSRCADTLSYTQEDRAHYIFNVTSYYEMGQLRRRFNQLHSDKSNDKFTVPR